MEELTIAEWESLCDNCGLCCLQKVEDEDTGELFYTDTPCRLLGTATCRCSEYANRFNHNPDCCRITPATVDRLRWLPHTCAYRLISGKRPLPFWHHLVCGDPQAVHHAGVSVHSQRLAGLIVVPGFGIYFDSSSE